MNALLTRTSTEWLARDPNEIIKIIYPFCSNSDCESAVSRYNIESKYCSSEVCKVNKISQARDKAISKLVVRAQKDEEFRNLLLNDPKKAVESETGKPVPSGVQIHVMEQSTSHVYVVLPERNEGELTDEDLEAASGGASDIVNMY